MDCNWAVSHVVHAKSRKPAESQSSIPLSVPWPIPNFTPLCSCARVCFCRWAALGLCFAVLWLSGKWISLFLLPPFDSCPQSLQVHQEGAPHCAHRTPSGWSWGLRMFWELEQLLKPGSSVCWCHGAALLWERDFMASVFCLRPQETSLWSSLALNSHLQGGATHSIQP